MHLPLGIAVGLIIAAASGQARADATLLHCTMQDAAGLATGGVIEKVGPPEALGKLLWGDFVVDLSTGAVHQGSYKPRMYTVIQAGGGSNDTVLMPVSPGPIDPALAATDFLRVRQWSTRPLFVAFDLDVMVTGICDPVL